MARKRALHHVFVRFACLFLALCNYHFCQAASTKMAAGMSLPEFTLEGPDSENFQKYLGLKAVEPFKVSGISGKLVLIDIMNVF
jgi:hypothetical protein